MNKPKLLIILSFISLFPLTACINTNHGEEISYRVVGSNLHIGDIPNDKLTLELHKIFEDGYVKKIKGIKPSYLTSIITEDDESINKKEALGTSGNYTCRANFNVAGKLYMENDIPFHVNSGFEDKFTLESFELINKHTYTSGEKILDSLALDLLFKWKGHGDEIMTYRGEDDVIFSLFEENGNVDVINEVLTAPKNYTLKAQIGEYESSITIPVNKGVIRYRSEDLTLTHKTYRSSSSPSQGEMKTLIIPITLSGDNCEEWTDTHLTEVNDFFFESSSRMSFKNYFETASFNKLHVSGMVADPYVETDEELTTNNIQEDNSYQKLFTVINNAVSYTIEHNPDIDWGEYDADNNGTFDNIHLCTNWNSAKAGSDGTNVWNTPLWPHQWEIGGSGTHEAPKVDAYSIDAIDHFHDAITAIHEQGHIFGLSDYYDYQYSGADYIGYADMQSMNMFDWNSFSKLSVGWVSPYVIDGSSDSVTVSMLPASLNGDCLLIPADYSTWNGSAFDEYFLLELFAPCQNNYVDWSTWSDQYNDLGKFGVRLYHVDSRLRRYHSTEETDDPSLGSIGCSNTRSNSQRDAWDDFPMLRLIQASGKDTFSKTGNSGSKSHYLSESDLFKEGDTFTFTKYAPMLSKYKNTITTMDNGETFPYTIHFDSMSKSGVTITISR